MIPDEFIKCPHADKSCPHQRTWEDDDNITMECDKPEGERCRFEGAPSPCTHPPTPCPHQRIWSNGRLECALPEGSPCPLEKAPAGALATQVGGEHYRRMKIQPVEYIEKNGLGFCEGCVVKYISRWRAKNGVEDLLKARHFIDILLEMHGGEKPPRNPAAASDS